jgi:hypothetical protein
MMKRVFLVSMLILIVAGLAYAKDFEVTKKSGPYTVVVKMDKNPPVMGDNGISITIKDADGKAIKDAKVTLDYEMPAMPGMPAMRYKAQPVLKDESYVGTVNFSMGGSWNLNIKISRGGKTDAVKFNVDVS